MGMRTGESMHGFSTPRSHGSAMPRVWMHSAALVSALFSQAADAQQTPLTKHPAPAHDPSPEADAVQLRHDLRALDSPQFDIRNSAQQRLMALLRDRSDANGNIHPHHDAVITAFESKGVSLEQEGRIGVLRDRLMNIREGMPGRVHCHEGTMQDLHRALETHFHIPSSSIPLLRANTPAARMRLHSLASRNCVTRQAAYRHSHLRASYCHHGVRARLCL